MVQAHNPNAIGSVVPAWANVSGPPGPVGPAGPAGPAGPFEPPLSTTVAVAPGPVTVVLDTRQLYDPTAGTFAINAPLAPAKGDFFGVKNVGTSATAVTISGNGQNIVDPVAKTLGASFSFSGAFAGCDFQFDGVNWLDVGLT